MLCTDRGQGWHLNYPSLLSRCIIAIALESHCKLTMLKDLNLLCRFLYLTDIGIIGYFGQSAESVIYTMGHFHPICADLADR